MATTFSTQPTYPLPRTTMDHPPRFRDRPPPRHPDKRLTGGGWLQLYMIGMLLGAIAGILLTNRDLGGAWTWALIVTGVVLAIRAVYILAVTR